MGGPPGVGGGVVNGVKSSTSLKNRRGALVVGIRTTLLEPTVMAATFVKRSQFVLGRFVALKSRRFGELVGQEIANAFVRFVVRIRPPTISEMFVGVA